MEIKQELLNIKLDYKNKINIPDEKFGIEIEFAGAIFNNVNNKLNEVLGYETKDIEQRKKLEEEKSRYKKWRLVNDGSVQANSYYQAKKGGEINSPIMKNKKKYWEELKEVCLMLKKQEYIKITSRCSIHVHTDKTIYNEVEEYKNLLKLWILYEDIIYKFAYGEINTPRETLLNFARPFCASFDIQTIKLIKDLENIETKQQLIKLLNNERKLGLNLTNILQEKNKEIKVLKPTIEIRVYNGTLNENLIQNIVRFNQNLLGYAQKENFDKEFIEYKIKNYEPFYYGETIKEKEEKAEEFSKLIFKDELDRLKFLKQYYKAYKENDIEKTLHL